MWDVPISKGSCEDFCEDSTSNTPGTWVMPAVVIIEIKRLCGYSQRAQGLQEALQFLSLRFPYSPLPLALLLPQALTAPMQSQKACPADTKRWDEYSWKVVWWCGPERPGLNVQTQGLKAREGVDSILVSLHLDDFHIHEPSVWWPMDLEIKNKLSLLLGEAETSCAKSPHFRVWVGVHHESSCGQPTSKNFRKTKVNWLGSKDPPQSQVLWRPRILGNRIKRGLCSQIRLGFDSSSVFN